MDRYSIFRALLDFVADTFVVSDADMNNYCGEIEIEGTTGDGSTISIRVNMKEAETDGN